MRPTSKHLAALGVAIAATLLAGCGDKNVVNLIPVNAAVSMQDQCDSASFNAVLGPGACTRNGSTTFAQFMAELTATQSVAAWRFDPSAFTIQVGQGIAAMNNGGEAHTFTAVHQFGGGMVPELNAASGNPVMAPECGNLPATAIVSPGGTFTTSVATSTGTAFYQCCIHPWMRSTVAVTQ
jgi:plastocyanin